ncbi:phosphopantetheine-binding protein [Stenoxybacter acetivorans]|uniref:phosphopantetheine-binding protein n=1 Tax=Stenoxybacter acetivorans TaxID=422441 RepID=UPI0005677B9F|nr:phosphopantetheine-binding protein [Stenoxybacter acetivorans]
MNTLEEQIKQLIIDSLGLEDIGIEDIDTAAPLFGSEGLGLDSVDALELGLAVQKAFGFTFENDSTALRAHFYSVKTLAAFVAAQSKK